MIILPCPHRPDLDCIASAFGYADYLTRVKNMPALAWIAGTPDDEAQYHLRRSPDLPQATEQDARTATAYIAVDFSTKAPLPNWLDVNRVVQVIDHRSFTTPADDFPKAKIQIDAVGAAATQITEYFMRDNVAPSTTIAAMLYGAIYSHTLCLKSTTTTDRDRAAIDWLADHVMHAQGMVTEQFRARTYGIISQMPDILTTEMKMETSFLGRYGFTLLEMQQAAEFWRDYRDDIVAWSQASNFPIIVNIIDVVRNITILYTSSPTYADILEDKLPGEMINNVMILQPAWFRKQIIPELK